MKKFLIASIAFILFFLIAFKLSAWAEDSSSSSSDLQTTPKAGGLRNEIRDLKQDKASQAAAKRQEKLSEARLKLCRARAISLKNKSNALLERAKKMNLRLEEIIKIVKNYYQNRLVPKGLTLSNYDSLLSDIDAKKTNVTTLINKAQTDVSGFSCDSDDPKTTLDNFHSEMKDIINALKEYKTSVRAFVSAVHDLSKQLEGPSLSPAQSATEGGEL